MLLDITGCLPLWKSFIEELFQRGLVKVVFATETLAAGINMPARTTVISSLIKRTGAGRTMLTPNELLQMAGRAGRRGIDKAGHVVLLQTPYEGPEECCDVLFAGIVPLVSQFTASYGMVLNLLAVSTFLLYSKPLLNEDFCIHISHFLLRFNIYLVVLLHRTKIESSKICLVCPLGLL